jgi:hypothetical protein
MVFAKESRFECLVKGIFRNDYEQSNLKPEKVTLILKDSNKDLTMQILGGGAEYRVIAFSWSDKEYSSKNLSSSSMYHLKTEILETGDNFDIVLDRVSGQLEVTTQTKGKYGVLINFYGKCNPIKNTNKF